MPVKPTLSWIGQDKLFFFLDDGFNTRTSHTWLLQYQEPERYMLEVRFYLTDDVLSSGNYKETNRSSAFHGACTLWQDNKHVDKVPVTACLPDGSKWSWEKGTDQGGYGSNMGQRDLCFHQRLLGKATWARLEGRGWVIQVFEGWSSRQSGQQVQRPCDFSCSRLVWLAGMIWG